MSESHTDNPLPGGGRRIAPSSPELDPEQLAAKLADETPAPMHAAPAAPAAHRSHRRAGPPTTIAPDASTGGRRRALVDDRPAAPEQPPPLPLGLDEEPTTATPTPRAQAGTAGGWAHGASAPTASAVVASDGGPPLEPPAEPTDPDLLRDDVPSDEEDQSDVAEDLDDHDELDPLDLHLADEQLQRADSLARPRTAWDGPIVAASRPSVELRPDPVAPDDQVDVAETSEPPPSRRSHTGIPAVLVAVTLAAALVAGAQVAETAGWIDSVADPVVRTGALVSTWCAVLLLSRRCGGRTTVIGGFAAIVFVLVGAFPETWALAGAAVTAGTVFGLLAMVYTRPARGIGLARELAVSAGIGLVGALVVAGYHVELRPYRFRMMVLAIALICAFLLAWRLGHGARSIGRRGGVIILVGVVMLAGSLAYVQAVRSWGSPSLVHSLDDFKASISDLLGAAPRPVEALVGFPALVWGVASRTRRRQGWWMCAFGTLGAAGITSSLIYPDTSVGSALASTGYDVVIGLAIGLLVVFIDGLLTGSGGRRADATGDLDADRPEPARLTPLLEL